MRPCKAISQSKTIMHLHCLFKWFQIICCQFCTKSVRCAKDMTWQGFAAIILHCQSWALIMPLIPFKTKHEKCFEATLSWLCTHHFAIKPWSQICMLPIWPEARQGLNHTLSDSYLRLKKQKEGTRVAYWNRIVNVIDELNKGICFTTPNYLTGHRCQWNVVSPQRNHTAVKQSSHDRDYMSSTIPFEVIHHHKEKPEIECSDRK